MDRPALGLTAITATAVGAVVGVVLAVSGHADRASAAATVDEAVTVARDHLSGTARDVHGNPGGELLSVDLRGDGSARVMLYDYTSGRTHQITVDAGKATADQSAVRMQPPASTDETLAAFGLALRAQDPLPFVTTFAQQQGVPLVSADQVKVEADPWSASDSGSAGASASTKHAELACARDRCTQLVVATAAGEYLDTRDFVVDLSAGRVIRLGKTS